MSEKKGPSPEIFELFDNPYPDRDYWITHICPEFTSVCPKTGQPDYGTLTFDIVADKKCVELKSLKLYLQAYRNEGIFYESVSNKIVDDLVSVLQPRYLKLTAEFTPRGGIRSKIVVEYVSPERRPHSCRPCCEKSKEK